VAIVRYISGFISEDDLVLELQAVTANTLLQPDFAFDLTKKELCLRLSDGAIYRFIPDRKQREKLSLQFNQKDNSQLLAVI
jgi:hypothetical protein